MPDPGAKCCGTEDLDPDPHSWYILFMKLLVIVLFSGYNVIESLK